MSALCNEDVLAEIVSFLKNPRPDVRCEALKSLIASLTASSADDDTSVLAARMAAANYCELNAPMLLCKLISSPLDALTEEKLPVSLPAPARMSWTSKVTCLALDAASALLGVGGEIAADAFVGFKIAGRAGEVLMDQLSALPASESPKPTATQSVVNSITICLANLSRSESGSAALLEKDSLLTALTKAFIDRPPTIGEDGASNFDPFEHIATVLMNLAQLPAGQKFLLRQSTSYLPQLLPSLQSPSVSRRYGVAGVIKNVCFDKDSYWYLIQDLDIVKSICYPLCGPEGFELDDKQGMDISWWMEGVDKVREEDAGIRQMLVEAILLLCATGRKSREILRAKKVYEVIQVMDLSEESEAVSEKICECVDFLKRDEVGEVARGIPLTEEEMARSNMIVTSQTNYDDVD